MGFCATTATLGGCRGPFCGPSEPPHFQAQPGGCPHRWWDSGDRIRGRGWSGPWTTSPAPPTAWAQGRCSGDSPRVPAGVTLGLFLGEEQGAGGAGTPPVSPFDHVLVDHGGDDGERDDVPCVRQHLRELLILGARGWWEASGGPRGPPPGRAARSACPGRILVCFAQMVVQKLKTKRDKTTGVQQPNLPNPHLPRGGTTLVAPSL